MESKKPWFSKTVWMSLIVALAAFIPGVSDWISHNTEMYGMILGAVFTALRLITKGKVSIE